MAQGLKRAAGVVILLGLVTMAWFSHGWYGSAEVTEDTSFVVPSGSSLTSVAQALEDKGYIASADDFLLRARIFGSDDHIQAGEFELTPGMSPAEMLAAFQSGDVVRRLITIPEGTPSIVVYEKLMAEDLLTGDIPVPPEGSLLPDSYDFERGEDRSRVVARMQSAMQDFLAASWPERAQGIAVDNVRDALILASIVEKETGAPEERRMVAGLYSNRLKTGMRLQADPTIIYPITKGKPLGRRIRRSEIAEVNDYNTYSMAGLPKGPITNPGRESIKAVLNPAQTDALYMVADGTGKHAFAKTLDEHQANVEKWFEIRRQRGEM